MGTYNYGAIIKENKIELISAIFFSEVKNNTLKRNHNEVEEFYPAFIFNEDNESKGVALFTLNEIEKALKRGFKNTEDVEQLVSYHTVNAESNENSSKLTWWKRFLFWL